jgi:ribosomal protein S27AE
MTPLKIIAVTIDELNQWGCPHCGYRSGSAMVQSRGTASWLCGECGITSVALGEGLTKSSIGIGSSIEGQAVYPELQDHPRRGTPAHGRPDNRPETGGEFFQSRGVGRDVTPGCFVCGGEKGMRNNIAAFVQCKEAGERVVAMFGQGAWLDFRPDYPDRVQVKVGACKEHVQELNNLEAVTWDGIITEGLIANAKTKEVVVSP